MVRRGAPYLAATPAFATLLREKYARSGLKNVSVEEFIEQIATRSSTTGKPYRVKLPGGEVVEAAVWLRRQADQLTIEPKAEANLKDPT